MVSLWDPHCSAAAFSPNWSLSMHHYHYMFRDRLSSGPASTESSPFAYMRKQTLRTYIHQAQPDSSISSSSSLFNSHTHTHCNRLHWLQLRLRLRDMNHSPPSSRQGGPLHPRDVTLGLCGHPAGSDFPTCEQEMSVKTSLTCLLLSSLTVITSRI